jgi:hypothetical protein
MNVALKGNNTGGYYVLAGQHDEWQFTGKEPSDWGKPLVIAPISKRIGTMTTSYETIQPPFTEGFREMSKRDLKRYSEWIMGIKDKRIEILEAAVRQSAGFEDWRADYAPHTFVALGSWFALRVTTRPQTPEELAEKRKVLFPLAEPPSWELTTQTFSIALDIGLYFGESLRLRHRHLHWEQYLQDRRCIDFGQVVLVGLGSVPLNSIHIMITLAYGLAGGERTGSRLAELYAVWDELALKAIS